jgi:phenylalanyl-tRNA synthetase beta chain
VLTPGGLNPEQRLRRKVRQWFVRRGWTEAITYSLTDAQSMGEVAPLYKTEHPILLQMPMSEERGRLRTGLLPHLLDVAEYNRNRKTDSLAVFELGKTFHAQQWPLEQLPDERWALAGLCTGDWRHHWSGEKEAVDFYFLKGLLEDLFAWLGLDESVTFEPWTEAKGFHPGRTARCRVGDVTLGMLGQLHPVLAERHHLKETYVFQLDFDALTRLAAEKEITYRPVPAFPAIQRDLAVIVPETVPAAEVEAVIREAAGQWLERLSLFDVYRGQPLGESEKSLAFSMLFRDPERTLTDDEVNEVHQRVVARLAERLGARLR